MEPASQKTFHLSDPTKIAFIALLVISCSAISFFAGKYSGQKTPVIEQVLPPTPLPDTTQQNTQALDIQQPVQLPLPPAPVVTPVTPTNQESASISITSPKNGATLCLGQPSIISWQGSGELNHLVQIKLTDDSTSYQIDSAPVSNNETGFGNYGSYSWKTGQIKGMGRLLGDGALDMYLVAQTPIGQNVVRNVISDKILVKLTTCEG